MNNPSLLTNMRFLTEGGAMPGRFTVHTDLTNRPSDPGNDFESFSFSVAHGLRASLRSINGFAKMLNDDKGAELDEEAKEYLKIIRDNAVRMDRLMDDLITLSRYYTAPVNKQTVDLNRWVNRIVAGMRYKGGLNIARFEHVNADAEMMHQLWYQLLTNAVKFTSKNPEPAIEVGAMQKGTDTVYFVKDNGAGFDMKYAGRLFTPFQRMHNEGEYPGAGIGLAIANKIVVRHGGQMWFEAEQGAGATFYFTLSEQ